MRIMRRVLKTIDSVSEHVGSWARWLTIVLVLVGTYDVIVRYGFNAPTEWAYETMMMVGGSIYALGWGYDLLHKSHIRVDMFYTNLSERGKAMMDSICAMIFFFPLFGVLVKLSTYWAVRAWVRHEVMMESYWYPPAGPFRTAIAIGAIVLLVQGIAKFVRDVYFVVRRVPLD